MTERWLPVLGHEGRYWISDQGRLRNARGRIMRPGPHKAGYALHHLALGSRDRREVRCAHVMVLESFVGPRPFPAAQARHLRGIAGGNSLDNLAWGSAFENAADKIAHGTHRFGEDAPVVKLSEADVLEIRSRPRASLKQLAAQFGVTVSNISAIRLRKSWRHI